MANQEKEHVEDSGVPPEPKEVNKMNRLREEAKSLNPQAIGTPGEIARDALGTLEAWRGVRAQPADQHQAGTEYAPPALETVEWANDYFREHPLATYSVKDVAVMLEVFRAKPEPAEMKAGADWRQDGTKTVLERARELSAPVSPEPPSLQSSAGVSPMVAGSLKGTKRDDPTGRSTTTLSSRPQERGISAEEVAATAYQILGAMEASVRVLDYFSAIAQGERPTTILPFCEGAEPVSAKPAARLLTAKDVAMKLANVGGVDRWTLILEEWLRSYTDRWKEEELIWRRDDGAKPKAGPPKKGPRWSYQCLSDRGITIPCNGREDCPMFQPYGTWSLHYHEPAAPVSPEPPRRCGICGNTNQPHYKTTTGGVACEECRKANNWSLASLELLSEAEPVSAKPEPPEWMQGAAREIVGRFGHTFPETKEPLETMNMAVPVVNIIRNHFPQSLSAKTQPSPMTERDFAKLLHIEYCDDLADEGTPWEVPAEPEPQYFATLAEAVDCFVNLPEVGSAKTKPSEPLGTCQSSASCGFGHSGGVPHQVREDCKEWIAPAPVEEARREREAEIFEQCAQIAERKTLVTSYLERRAGTLIAKAIRQAALAFAAQRRDKEGK